MDHPGARHRLDHRADRLGGGVSEIRRAKRLQRVDVWGDGELVEALPVIALNKADVEALSAESNPACNMWAGLLWLARERWTSVSVPPGEALLHGSPKRLFRPE